MNRELHEDEEIDRKLQLFAPILWTSEKQLIYLASQSPDKQLEEATIYLRRSRDSDFPFALATPKIRVIDDTSLEKLVYESNREIYHPNIPDSFIWEVTKRVVASCDAVNLEGSVYVRSSYFHPPIDWAHLPFLPDLLAHELGHLSLEEEIQLPLKNLPKEVQKKMQEDVEQWLEEWNISGPIPEIYVGIDGFRVYYLLGDRVIGSEKYYETSTKLEEIYADLFGAFLLVHALAYKNEISPDKALDRLLEFYKKYKETFQYDFCLYSYLKELGLQGCQRIIQSSIRRRVLGFLDEGRKTLGEERNKTFLSKINMLRVEKEKKRSKGV